MRNLELSSTHATCFSQIEGVRRSRSNVLESYSMSSPLHPQVERLCNSNMSFHTTSTLLPQFDGLHTKTLIGPRWYHGSNNQLPTRQKDEAYVPNISATLSVDKEVKARTKTQKGTTRNGVLVEEKGNSSSSRSSNGKEEGDSKIVLDGFDGSVLGEEEGDLKVSYGSFEGSVLVAEREEENSGGKVNVSNGSSPRGVQEVENDDTSTATTLVGESKSAKALESPIGKSDKEFSGVPRSGQTLPIVQSAKVTNLQDLITKNQDPNSLPKTLLNIADNLISAFLAPPTLDPSMDPAIQLAGGCTPVGETPPTPCTVIRGAIPADLNGAYIRNGPNATHLHEGEGFHLFDGDGMLHSIFIENGAATFAARYVKTSRFRQEAAAGRALFPKYFGGMYGPSGFARLAVTALRTGLGMLDITDGGGLSNTSVGFFAGKVLSLSEDDMPYVVKVTGDGDLETVGKYELPWKLNMCAHPKFDYFTGEMYAFSFQPTPYVTPYSFFRVSADGVKSPDIPVPVGDLPLVHDFAITRNFVVFPENQLVLRPTGLLNGQMPVTCDSNKTARFCVLPRYGLPEDAIANAQWFDAPGLNCLHYLTAWEEDDEVVVITPVLSPAEGVLEIPAVNTYNTLSEVRLNRKTGEVGCRKLCSGNFDFGTVNPKYIGGKKTRYGYLARGHFPYLNGIVKVDFEKGAIVGERQFDEGCHSGEPFFVPKEGDNDVAEDDGYIVCYLTDEKSGVSEFLVMDALSPSLEIIAAVELPSRVPVGFHGYFITKEQLDSQR